jgi:hypothetical protein
MDRCPHTQSPLSGPQQAAAGVAIAGRRGRWLPSSNAAVERKLAHPAAQDVRVTAGTLEQVRHLIVHISILFKDPVSGAAKRGVESATCKRTATCAKMASTS